MVAISVIWSFVTNDSPARLTAFRRAFRAWRGDAFSHRPFGEIYLGCETARIRRLPLGWHATRRGPPPPAHRLSGDIDRRRLLRAGIAGWTVGPETAFFAVLPSRHLYYLPVDAAEWSFFWFTFTHPYVVRRLAQLAGRHPPVFPLPAESSFGAQCLAFFEHTCQGRFADHFAEEGALLDWTLGLERHLHDLAHPRDRREAMLREVRQFVQDNLRRSFGIEEIARKQPSVTQPLQSSFPGRHRPGPRGLRIGNPPGRGCRCLRETTAPLKDIASQTGFADANHLCKAFRRRYHLTPGTYRQQVTP